MKYCKGATPAQLAQAENGVVEAFAALEQAEAKLSEKWSGYIFNKLLSPAAVRC